MRIFAGIRWRGVSNRSGVVENYDFRFLSLFRIFTHKSTTVESIHFFSVEEGQNVIPHRDGDEASAHRSPRPEGPRAGCRVLGQRAPCPPDRSLGERHKLTSRVRGRAPENLKFDAT